MGNWRTVQIIGACGAADVPALKRAISVAPDYSNFHPLLGGLGLAGLPVWAAEAINAVGNLAERGYDVDDVANTLRDLAMQVPSLAVKVHCGGDYESRACIATVTLAAGAVSVGPAEIAELPDIPPGQIEANFFAQLRLPLF
jgi:hypothetical protein